MYVVIWLKLLKSVLSVERHDVFYDLKTAVDMLRLKSYMADEEQDFY